MFEKWFQAYSSGRRPARVTGRPRARFADDIDRGGQGLLYPADQPSGEASVGEDMSASQGGQIGAVQSGFGAIARGPQPGSNLKLVALIRLHPQA